MSPRALDVLRHNLKNAGQWPERIVTAPERWAYLTGILPKERLALPNFLGIGGQKCGTTWLHANLAKHPELYLPPEKEIHYFNRRIHKRLQYYSSRFEAGRDRVRGEINPGYCLLTERRVAYVHRLMPELKIVFLMRNPMDRAWSQAVMNLAKFKGRKFEEVPEAEFVEHVSHSRTAIRNEYLEMLGRWRRFYPPERFCYGFFEEISEKPQDLLRRVFRHLGVTEDVDWATFPFNEVINKGEGRPMPPRVREILSEIYREPIERLHAEFGEPVARWRV